VVLGVLNCLYDFDDNLGSKFDCHLGMCYVGTIAYIFLSFVLIAPSWCCILFNDYFSTFTTYKL
jgi:hypothetical protein